jgi:hypothetical protein
MKLRIPAARMKASRNCGLRILIVMLSMASLGKTCNQANTIKSTGVHTICKLYDRPLSKRPEVNLNVTTGLVSPKPDIRDREAITISIAALQRDILL